MRFWFCLKLYRVTRSVAWNIFKKIPETVSRKVEQHPTRAAALRVPWPWCFFWAMLFASAVPLYPLSLSFARKIEVVFFVSIQCGTGWTFVRTSLFFGRFSFKTINYVQFPLARFLRGFVPCATDNFAFCSPTKPIIAVGQPATNCVNCVWHFSTHLC